jgi:hypothetical protein
LASLEINQDLAISWSRNKTTLADGAVFGSFYAGRYMSSYDQWGSYQSTASPLFNYDAVNNVVSQSENYENLQRYNHGGVPSGPNSQFINSDVYLDANCGKVTVNKYRNGSVMTIPLIKKAIPNTTPTWTSTTCSAKDSDLATAKSLDSSNAAFYSIVYSNQRLRKQYVSDRGRLVATSDKSQVLRFSDLISREKNGDFNFCSAYKGFVQSRQVYVQLSDLNGRQLMEMREIWWDYPNKNIYPGNVVSDRPNQATDPLFLANTSVGKVGYTGARGFVHAAQTKQGSECLAKVW